MSKVRERLRSALFAASGLPTMYRAVADCMGSSQAAHMQMQTARWFGGMANASAKAANFELESSRAELPSAGSGASDERVALERETGALNEVAANVERSAKNIELQFSTIIGEEMTGLRQALQAVVVAHAAKERDVLIATLEGGAPRALGPSKASHCGAPWLWSSRIASTVQRHACSSCRARLRRSWHGS